MNPEVQNKKRPKPKIILIAVILNLFPYAFGLGYIYVGRPLRFVVAFGLQLSTLPFMEAAGFGQYNIHLLVIIWIITLFDVANLVKKYNEQLSKT